MKIRKDVKLNGSRTSSSLSQPIFHQHAKQVQEYNQVIRELPLGLSMEVRQEVVKKLNQVLADTITIKDLYKKSHWQVSGATFYQLHLLFDKHYSEQNEMIDSIAERVQLLGGISIAMGGDVAEHTKIKRPPQGREEVLVQISRLLDAHEIIIKEARAVAKRAEDLEDVGTTDLLISSVLRTNEMQAWFLYEHLVNMPLLNTNQK